MDFQGERFELDLSDDAARQGDSMRSMPTLDFSSFVGDIQEREISAPQLPSAPTMKNTSSGFPEHKKRNRTSAFKQQRAATRDAESTSQPAPELKARTTPPTHPTNGSGFEDTQRQAIDEENRSRIANMSEAEIENEQRELLNGLPASLIERLLKRANIDEDRGDTGIYPQNGTISDAPSVKSKNENDERDSGDGVKGTAHDAGVSIPTPTGKPVEAAKSVRFVDDDEAPEAPIDIQAPASESTPSLQGPTVHFPAASAPPELDPADPSFLEHLHEKYFPSLPVDPSKLAWMAPLPSQGSPADRDSPYYPGQEAVAASAIRFDFRGGILPPRIARAVPVNRGLHHHGEAPESAGYTIPELARLARSAYPAQRCLAFQTLGRFLYRLGRGEFGKEKSEMAKGLWKCVEEGRVLETLQQAANAEGGHRGSKTYAVEAVWLWQKGGGKGAETDSTVKSQ